MTGVVLARATRDAARSLAGWLAGVASLALLTVLFYPAVRDQAAELTRLLDRYPDAMKALFGLDGVDYGSPDGYLRVELFGFMVPLLFVLVGVARGSAAVAGEGDARTLDLLLSTPLSRTRLVVEKYLAALVTLTAMAAVLVVVVLGTGRLVGAGFAIGTTVSSVVRVWLLGAVFTALGLAAGAAFGRRGRASAVCAGYGLAAFLVNALSALVPVLRAVRWLTPFAYYADGGAVRTGFAVWQFAVPAVASVLLVGAAAAVFARRDVRG